MQANRTQCDSQWLQYNHLCSDLFYCLLFISTWLAEAHQSVCGNQENDIVDVDVVEIQQQQQQQQTPAYTLAHSNVPSVGDITRKV